jgi:hemoglobin-like flavoprotein
MSNLIDRFFKLFYLPDISEDLENNLRSFRENSFKNHKDIFNLFNKSWQMTGDQFKKACLTIEKKFKLNEQ